MNGASAQAQIDQLKKEAKVNKSELNAVVRALGSTNQALLGLATSIAQHGVMLPNAWIEQDLSNIVDAEKELDAIKKKLGL